MTATPPMPSSKRHRPLRWLGWSLAALALLLVLLVALAAVVFKTEAGTRVAWRTANSMLPGLSGELLQGTLADGVEIRDFRFESPGSKITADRISGRWTMDWRPLSLTIKSLEIGTLDVTPAPQPDDKPDQPPPDQIKLPLALDLRRASIGLLRLHLEGGTQTVSGIDMSARSDGVNHQIALLRATTPWGPARAELKIDGSGPVRVNGDASLNARVLDQPVAADLRLSGPLERLDARLRIEGRELDGQIDLIATPFAELPLETMTVAIDHLNPRDFVPSAPRAELQLRAELEPAPQPGQQGGQKSGQGRDQQAGSALLLRGQVSIRNGRPGTIDDQLIPLESLRAQLMLSANEQKISELQAELLGQGQIAGSASMEGGDGRLQLQAHDLNLQRIYSTLQSTRLSGPLDVRLDGSSQRIEARLTGEPMAIAAVVDLTPGEIVIQEARLQSGPSVLQASGTLGRGEAAAFSLTGKLKDFDPNRFITLVRREGPGGAGIPPGTRVNMDFSASGQMQPQLQADLAFAIANSRFNDLPMSGRGKLRVQGERLLPSQAELTVGGNDVFLDGSFGRSGDQLKFRIDAPALARLGVGVSGRVQARGTLAGSIDQPVVNAQWDAQQLAYGDQRLARFTGTAAIDGIPGRDEKASADISISGGGLRAGPLSLNKLQATLEGTSAAHRLKLSSSGKLRGQPIDLELAARGALSGIGEQAGSAGPSWSGTISALENRGFPRLSLRQPLKVVQASADRVELGSTRIVLEQAIVELEDLIWGDDMVRSAGRLQNLNIGHLLRLYRDLSGTELPLSSDLVLDGEWDLALAGDASGSLNLARRRGDVILKSDRGNIALGITRLGVTGRIEGDDLRINAGIGTRRLGNVDVNGTVGLVRQAQLMLPAPGSPLALQVLGSVPRLSTIAAIAGPSVALEGRLNADIRITGTLGEPVLAGSVLAQDMALTLFDLGVRLHDGVARLELANNVVELKEVVFEGGDGTLRATGRIPLDRSRADLGASIVAERLQLLANPSRSLTLSGKAVASNQNGQLQINGDFTVDRAEFSLPEQSAPQLGDDVVVIDRQGAPPPQAKKTGAPAEAPGLLPPRVELNLNLGQDFYFRGSGAELRLVGSLTIRSGPGQPPQAFGTIRVADGVYEAFGAELAIERGVITFQGPFDNPGINILAMRRDQEVPAGVQVTGNAQKPRIQLVSEPDLSQEEKLSWLVFGRGTSTGGGGAGQAQTALQGAALGLLNKLGSSQIAGGLGLSEVKIGSSEYGALAGQPVVTLGKEISNRLFVGYEQSLAGIGGVLKLTYELSQHWSVVLLGGAVAGLDLLYSDRFDSWSGRNRR